jgi:hypothetical protein
VVCCFDTDHWRALCTYLHRGRYRGHLLGRYIAPRQALCRGHLLNQCKAHLPPPYINPLLSRYTFRLQAPCTYRRLARYKLRLPDLYTSPHPVRYNDLRLGRNIGLVAKCYGSFNASQRNLSNSSCSQVVFGNALPPTLSNPPPSLPGWRRRGVLLPGRGVSGGPTGRV